MPTREVTVAEKTPVDRWRFHEMEGAMTVTANDLEGVMVALLTPVGDDGAVDHHALSELVGSLVSAGVAGISPLGTTGEGASLSVTERLAVVDSVVASVPDAMPVIPGVFRNVVAEAVDELAAYADHGAGAALVAPPHYFPLPAADLHAFFERTAERSVLPLVLYNIPSFTKNAIAPPVIGRLAGHGSIVGVKDSSRDMEHLLEMMDALETAGVTRRDFAVLTGTDTMLLASLAAGASGAIVASANVVPEVTVGIHRAWTAGDLVEAHRLEARLRAVVAACRTGAYPAGWKAAAALTGRCRPWLVPPRMSLAEPATTHLAQLLAELGVLDGSARSTEAVG